MGKLSEVNCPGRLRQELEKRKTKKVGEASVDQRLTPLALAKSLQAN